MPLLTHVQAIM